MSPATEPAPRWHRLRDAQPGIRARDAAAMLAVSEAELIVELAVLSAPSGRGLVVAAAATPSQESAP